MNIHLIDGTFELFRAFFGAPATTAPDGMEVGATRAFMRSMVALHGRAEVSHVGVAFDTVIESFRNQLFAGYKTGEGLEPLLHAQFPLVEQAAEALGLVVWRMHEGMEAYEADDALAAAAVRAIDDGRVARVVLCTPDKDLTQCVRDDRVVTWDRIRDKVLDRAGVVAKFGVEPASIPDYLALVGDTADGIPGVPRWGAKSAAAVLSHYRHIEAIPKEAKDWQVSVRGAAGLAKALGQRRSDALLYRRLATLRTDVPLEEDVDALEWRGARREQLEQVCARLGEKTLLGRITRWRA
jgi:5'-3' exonuclease